MVKGKALLKKSPAGKEINDNDVFSFNDKFDSKLMKIKFAAAGAQKEVRCAPCATTTSCVTTPSDTCPPEGTSADEDPTSNHEPQQ